MSSDGLVVVSKIQIGTPPSPAILESHANTARLAHPGMDERCLVVDAHAHDQGSHTMFSDSITLPEWYTACVVSAYGPEHPDCAVRESVLQLISSGF